jgi:mono/diheme cytochrome c family protein
MARATCVVVASLMVIWGAPALSAQSAAAIEQGKKVYASNRCQVCHSIEGQGNKKGPLEGVGKKLSADEIRAWMTDAEGMTAKTKAARKPPMKSYPNIAKADLDALVAYVQSLK